MVLENKKDKTEKKELTPLEKKLEELTQQLSTLQTTANKTVEDEAKAAKEKAELEQKEKLEANSDLAELLKTAGAEDEANKTEPNVESLTNRQLLDSIAMATDTALSARLETQKTEFGKVLEENQKVIQGLQKVVLSFLAKTRIDEVKAEHPDFDKFGPAIQQVLKDNQGMDIGDAYILAKGKTAGSLPPVHIAETEKPGIPMGPMNLGGEDETNKSKGKSEIDMTPVKGTGSRVAEFRGQLNAAVEKTLSQTPKSANA